MNNEKEVWEAFSMYYPDYADLDHPTADTPEIASTAWVVWKSAWATATKPVSGWQPIETVKKDGKYYRFHYGFGQEAVLMWSKSRHYWVNFETDVNYDAGNDGLGNPSYWMPYEEPTATAQESGQ